MHTYTQKKPNEAASQALSVARRWTWRELDHHISHSVADKDSLDSAARSESCRRHWWPVPIEAQARRGGDAYNFSDYLDAALEQKAAGVEVGIILEHAGAHAFSWSTERVVSAGEVSFLPGGRVPRRASSDEWEHFIRLFVERAREVFELGLPLGLAADDDTLLHAQLSPRLNPGVEQAERETPFFSLLQKLLDVDEELFLFLCVDDLCPGGIDPLGGQEMVQRVVEERVKNVVLSTGSRGLGLLLERSLQVPTGADQKNVALTSPAARMAALVDAKIFAVGPFEESALASSYGSLAGLMFWSREI